MSSIDYSNDLLNELASMDDWTVKLTLIIEDSFNKSTHSTIVYPDSQDVTRFPVSIDELNRNGIHEYIVLSKGSNKIVFPETELPIKAIKIESKGYIFGLDIPACDKLEITAEYVALTSAMLGTDTTINAEKVSLFKCKADTLRLNGTGRYPQWSVLGLMNKLDTLVCKNVDVTISECNSINALDCEDTKIVDIDPNNPIQPEIVTFKTVTYSPEKMLDNVRLLSRE